MPLIERESSPDYNETIANCQNSLQKTNPSMFLPWQAGGHITEIGTLVSLPMLQLVSTHIFGGFSAHTSQFPPCPQIFLQSYSTCGQFATKKVRQGDNSTTPAKNNSILKNEGCRQRFRITSLSLQRLEYLL
jgi:hypothetical protein